MTDWLVYTQDSNDDWVLDYTMPRPNDDLETNIISTQLKVELADGSNGFLTPETKYKKEPFEMFFANSASAFRTEITGYITANEKVKIITHSAESFIGYFVGMVRVWLSGVTDEYDISVTFENTE